MQPNFQDPNFKVPQMPPTNNYGEAMPQQNSVQGQKWQLPAQNFDNSKPAQGMNFLQGQLDKHNKLSWQHPESGVNHFEYNNRQQMPTQGQNNPFTKMQNFNWKD